MTSIGTDPEFMIIDREHNLKSAIGIVRGSKTKKFDLGDGASMFYDNVNMEINISPSYSSGELIDRLSKAFYSASATIAPMTFKPIASATFPESQLTHKDAKKFGCDPEYCAYEMSMVQPPEGKDGFRSAGGHIHLGSDLDVPPLKSPLTKNEDGSENADNRNMDRVKTIRMMDLFVGIPSVLMDSDPSSAARRKLYGKAGYHRPCPYGVEYRSMGNFWLMSPKLVNIIYNLSMFAVKFTQDSYCELWDGENPKYDVQSVRYAIDKTDKKIAAGIMSDIVKKYINPALFQSVFISSEYNNTDFYREWGLR